MISHKILQIGLGSMGKRRIRNLYHLGHKDITGYDIRQDRREEAMNIYGINIVNSDYEIDWDQFTCVIISTPPDQHHQYIIKALKLNKHTFVEASVLDSEADLILELDKSNKAVLAPSCTMRFEPLIKKSKEVIDSGAIGKILLANHHFGQYLPYWHPHEDLKDFYVSNKITGAAREIVPFDFVYLVWLFGMPEQIVSFYKNSNTLNIDIDDIYSIICQTEKKIQLQVVIDVVSRVSQRDTRIVGESGNMILDIVKGKLSIYSADTDSWQYFSKDSLLYTKNSEQMYIEEMNTFFNAVNGIDDFPYTFEEDIKMLNILYQAEKSFNNLTINMI